MEETINTLREFNRFYTRLLGVMEPRFLGTDLSLAEARLLLEINHGGVVLAADLQARLGMDAGFVSRVLKRFEARGWIARDRNAQDARRRPITPTAAGEAMFGEIDRRQRDRVIGLLKHLNKAERAALTASLKHIQSTLQGQAGGRQSPPAFTLRPFRTGDLGLIASRQSILYAQSHGWGHRLEVVLGETTTAFLRNFKPGREQCWIAEIGGQMAGSVMMTDEGNGLARLRLLYVEPFARGAGVGNALVTACLRFAEQTGYRSITLWTQSVLESARRIYAAHGFEMSDVQVHHGWGVPVQGETWHRTGVAGPPYPGAHAPASTSATGTVK